MCVQKVSYQHQKTNRFYQLFYKMNEIDDMGTIHALPICIPVEKKIEQKKKETIKKSDTFHLLHTSGSHGLVIYDGIKYVRKMF